MFVCEISDNEFYCNVHTCENCRIEDVDCREHYNNSVIATEEECTNLIKNSEIYNYGIEQRSCPLNPCRAIVWYPSYCEGQVIQTSRAIQCMGMRVKPNDFDVTRTVYWKTCAAGGTF